MPFLEANDKTTPASADLDSISISSQTNFLAPTQQPTIRPNATATFLLTTDLNNPKYFPLILSKEPEI
jgi:hypothetical protein